ncbi:dinitrogenase iron-molybdenum cofactor [candidate division WOR-3 bacterium RBG_13_43_14]|uniref:Dinitrogenase iron-molybdenum cofactor n=1 Tax=candidate division WOR-3 bacterium RBG_13_43_14 TaxID=1802590 RepID=A0A1F4UAF8_UNCW3|nr:MAG: dinitrogenase iron-molybdenum cofactor [candidate division WOR-3 bacterium RBG_13_43_14]
MRIAISTDGKYVSAHFGRCPSFTIIDINDGKIIKKEIVQNPGHQPGAIPQFLHEKGVECIVAGGMGTRATQFFSQYDIQTITGVEGLIDEVVTKLSEGKLTGGPSLCKPGAGKGYGLDKDVCDHSQEDQCEHKE